MEPGKLPGSSGLRLKTTIPRLLELLAQEYGPHPWQPHRDPLSELIYALLSQHTSDRNSQRAFDELRRRLPTWEAVAQAPVAEIAAAIWAGGLARVKAPRLKELLGRIQQERGSLDLSFLAEIPLDQARGYLRALPGVGPKSAGCVLLFALGRPALPVDTHVHRVSQRLGLLSNKTSAEQAHQRLEELIPPEAYYHFHVSLITHGRQVCAARRPRCAECVLNQVCPSAFTFG